MKVMLSAALAVLLSTAGVYAEAPTDAPAATCSKGSVAELKKTAGSIGVEFIQTVDPEAVKNFAKATIAKLHAPEVVLTASSFVIVKKDKSPLVGVYFFDAYGCYMTGANLPASVVMSVLGVDS